MRDESPICATLRAAEAEGLAGPALEQRVWERHATTCAMLALDSSGMTRISRSLGIVHFLARYLQMRDLAEVVLARHGCRSWRSFADNLFAEFDDTDTALAVALEIHAGLKQRGVMLTEDEPYRVGIGLGHARVLDNGPLGVMGAEMNLVAKLAEDIAEGGDTLLTDSARRSLRAPGGTSFETCQHTVSRVEITYHRVRV